jgi:hypothetical protein
MRKVLYYVGMFVLALVTFVFAVQATFPYDRVKQKLEEAASAKYDLSIFEIERGIMPGVFYLKNVTLKTRPAKDELERHTDRRRRNATAIAQLPTTITSRRGEHRPAWPHRWHCLRRLRCDDCDGGISQRPGRDDG